MNDAKIQQLIKAREAELQSVVSQHEAMRQDFLQKGQANQLRVTHLEGCIAQLKALLPKAKKKK